MNKIFEDLPDESAVTLIAERLDLAKNNNQPFTLERFDFKRHQRGLCVGLTEGNTAIALFYVFENGLYTWAYRAHIHVIPERPTICWLSPPLQLGMTYWFSPSDHGEGHYKAVAMGTETEIKRRYVALHQFQVPIAILKRKATDTEDDGTSPVLHPIDPFSSGDNFGL